jgi:hypothetical protein
VAVQSQGTEEGVFAARGQAAAIVLSMFDDMECRVACGWFMHQQDFSQQTKQPGQGSAMMQQHLLTP